MPTPGNVILCELDGKQHYKRNYNHFGRMDNVFIVFGGVTEILRQDRATIIFSLLCDIMYFCNLIHVSILSILLNITIFLFTFIKSLYFYPGIRNFVFYHNN